MTDKLDINLILNTSDKGTECNSSGKEEDSKRKHRHKRLKLSPSVHNLKDLISLYDSGNRYKNYSYTTLEDITPSLRAINNMIGMKSLKETIFYQVLYYLKGLHRGTDDYLHCCLFGKPGTGKTTVAKILGDLYKNLGILNYEEKSTFRIARRDDLIGKYLGHTAIKTRQLLESCIGGVLLIDEAYSLGPGQQDRDSFSKEAIDTINEFLSEHKHDFCCIIAGYEEQIKK